MKGMKKSILSFVLTLAMVATQNAGFVAHAQEDSTSAAPVTDVQSNAKTDFSYENKDLTLTAKAPEEAKLPEGSEIKAEVLNQDSNDYKDAVKKLNDVTFDYTLYNIYVEKDDQKIEPAKGLTDVTVTLKNPLKVNSDQSIKDSYVVHLNNDKREKLDGKINTNAKGDVTSFNFKTTSFSPIGLAIKKTVTKKAPLKAAAATETGDNTTTSEGKEYSLMAGGNAAGWVDQSATKLEIKVGDEWKTVDNKLSEIPAFAQYRLFVKYRTPADNTQKITDKDSVTFDVPEWIDSLDQTSGKILVKGTECGNWNYVPGTGNSKGKIAIKYNKDFIEKENFNLETTVTLTGSVDTSTITTTNKTINLDVLGVTKSMPGIMTNEEQHANIEIYKEDKNTHYRGDQPGQNKNTGNEIDSIDYKITVLAGTFKDGTHEQDTNKKNNAVLNHITISDEFTVEETYNFDSDFVPRNMDNYKKWFTYEIDESNTHVIKGNGQVDNTRSVTVDKSTPGKATFYIKNNEDDSDAGLKPDEKIEIAYKAHINDEFYEHDPVSYYDSDKNQTHATGGESNAHINLAGLANDSHTLSRRNQSFTRRRASNKATVEAKFDNNTVGPKTSVVEKSRRNKNDQDNDYLIQAKKIWLFKEGNTTGKYDSDYRILVNERPFLDITDWTLTDDLHEYNQKLTSDITIKTEHGPDGGRWNAETAATITSEDFTKAQSADVAIKRKDSNEVIAYLLQGSTIRNFTIKFTKDYSYRILFSATKDDMTQTNQKAQNGAILREPDQHPDTSKGEIADKDTYGVYEQHDHGGDVKKSLRDDNVNMVDGKIKWRSTIFEGVNIQNGSVYRDYVGWSTYKDNNSDENSRTGEGDILGWDHKGTNPQDSHKFVPGDLNLTLYLIQDPQNNRNQKTELKEGEDQDYTVTFLTPEQLKAENDDLLYPDKFTDCFQITFKKHITGRVIIDYESKASVSNLKDYREVFTNHCRYWSNGLMQNNKAVKCDYYDNEHYSYVHNGSIKKEYNPDNKTGNIEWDVTVNGNLYQTQELEVRDTIGNNPKFADQNFKLTQDSFGFAHGTDEILRNKANDLYKNAWKNTTNSGSKDNNSYVEKDGTVTKVYGYINDNDYFIVSYDSDPSKKLLRLYLHGQLIDKHYIKFVYKTTPVVSDLSKMQGNDEKLTYDNVAKVYHNDDDTTPIETSEASKELNFHLLTKKDPKYSEETAPLAHYTVDVNPTGSKLSSNGKVSFGDHWGLKDAAEGVDATIMPDSITVNGKKIANDPDYTLSIDSDNKGFNLEMPDELAEKVEYDVYFNGKPGQSMPISNTATVSTTSEDITTTNTPSQLSIAKPSVKVSLAKRIKIKKVDADKTSKALSGAQFSIYKMTGNNYDEKESKVDGNDLETSADGSCSTYDSNDSTKTLTFDNDKVYGIFETKAPNGYQLPDHNETVPVAKFVFLKSDSDNPYEKDYPSDVTQILDNVTDYVFMVKDPIKKIKVSATKVWNDKDNQDGLRKDVTLHLMKQVEGQKNSEEVGKAKTISKDASGDDLKVTWDNLPAYEDGKKVTYSVNEDSIKDYKSVITGDESKGFTVTNSHTPATVNVKGEKTWNDANYKDKNGYQRPDSIEVTLTGTVGNKQVSSTSKTVTADKATGKWSYEFNNLAKYSAGKEITYTVSETKVGEDSAAKAGYAPTYTNATTDQNGDIVEDITNTPKKYEKDDITPVQLTITKKDGKSDKHGVLAGAEFTAVKDGAEPITATTDANGQATLNFNEEGTYTLKETKAPEGYVVSDELKNGLTVEVKKSAADKVELKVENNESFFQWFYHLFFGNDKNEYTYGYNENTHTGILEVTNNPEMTKVTATKVWDDKDNQDGLRKDVTLHLFKTVDGATNEVSSKTIKADATGDDLRVAWDNLPAYEDGKKISYSVTEDKMDGYESKVEGDESKDFTFTNSHTPKTVTVKGQKTWNDEKYLKQKGYKRPENITVKLSAYVDGNLIDSLGKEQKVEADKTTGKWNYEFKDLPEYQPGKVGKKVIYTVSESQVEGKTPSDAGYESTVNGTDITNTPKDYSKDDITPVQLTITKKDGKSDKHGVLAGAEFTAVKDGAEPITATTDASGQATLNFTEEGTYTLKETKAPEGYVVSDELKNGLTVEVKKSAADKVELKVDENNNGFFQWFYHLFFGNDKDHYTYGYNEDTHTGVLEVTNNPELTKVTAAKVWDDKDNQDKLRKDVTFHLKKTVDGATNEVSSKTIKADASGDDLRVTWANLPAYEDGKKISYSITEDKLNGYESKVEGDESKGFTVTNTHTPTPETPSTPETPKNETPTTPETPKNETPKTPETPKNETPVTPTTTTTTKKPKKPTQSKKKTSQKTSKESKTDTESSGDDVGSGKNSKNPDTEAESDSENENGGHKKGSYRTDDSHPTVQKGSETNTQNAQNSKSPKTGDMTNIDLYLTLLGIAAIVIVVILKKFKFMNR